MASRSLQAGRLNFTFGGLGGGAGRTKPDGVIAVWRPVAVLGLVVLLSGAGAAPLPKKAEPPAYFPTAVGARWVFETSGGHQTTEVVTAVEAKAGGQAVSVGREDGGRVLPELTVLVAADGLSLLAVGGHELKKPHRVLKVPHMDGGKWADGSQTTAVYGPERVEVPAGTYDAIRVEVERPFDGGTMQSVTWYAPGVGPVRRVLRAGGAELVEALKSFRPGGK
jgi:hypothetical protein